MRSSTYKINLETITFEATRKIIELDKTLVGTPDYLGVTYFWGLNSMKYYLRDASIAQRVKVHKKWLEAGLELDGETIEHYKIMANCLRLPVNKLLGENGENWLDTKKRFYMHDEESSLWWAVRVIEKGDCYGKNDCLTYDGKICAETGAEDPLVEFYDTRYIHTKDVDGVALGQFVDRYYQSSLLKPHKSGLCLNGDVKSWNISAKGIEKVAKFLIERKTNAL